MHLKRNLGILAIAGILATAVAIPSATAKTHAPKTSVKQLDPIPKGSCDFQVDLFQLNGPQKETTVNEPNGETAKVDKGKLVIRFVNHDDPKKSSVQDVSGTTKTINHKGNLLEVLGDGRNYWGLGAGGQKNTGRPGLIITDGPVDVRVDLNTKPDPTVLQLTTLNNQQIDLCKVLASKR